MDVYYLPSGNVFGGIAIIAGWSGDTCLVCVCSETEERGGSSGSGGTFLKASPR